MKSGILVCVLCLCCMQLNAQLRVGIRAGLNTIDIDEEQLLVLDANDAESLGLSLKDANYGVHMGLMFLIQTNRFYFLPEFLFNSNSTDYRLEDFNEPGLEDEILTEKYQYLDVPITMGLKLGPVRIGGGPVGHVFLNSTSDLLDIDGYEQDFENLELGWQAGLGVDVWNIHLDFRYEGNLSKFGDHINFFGREYQFSQYPSRVIGSIGISF